MRIIAGKFRGTALTPVGKGDPAAHLRPTTDRVRESLFNVLANHDVLNGARVLDLFAGTGALGLEALSRGTEAVTFVENGRKALSLLSKNIDRLCASQVTQIVRQDATRLNATTGPGASLVFLDPPYGQGLGEKALERAAKGGWIEENAMIVWEDSTAKTPPSEAYEVLDQRRYGDSYITLLSYLGGT